MKTKIVEKEDVDLRINCNFCGSISTTKMNLSNNEINSMADNNWIISTEEKQTILTKYKVCNDCIDTIHNVD